MGFADTAISTGAQTAVSVGISTGNPYLVGAAVAWLVGDFIWNWATQDKPAPPAAASEIALPVVAEGTPVPIIYGRVEVDAPMLAYTSPASAIEGSSVGVESAYIYRISMLFILGLTPPNTRCKLFGMTLADVPCTPTFLSAPYNTLTGDGGFEMTHVGFYERTDMGDNRMKGGYLEFLNGKYSTQWTTPGHAANTHVAADMAHNLVFPERIPNYHNYLSVFLFNHDGGLDNAWEIGPSPQIDSVKFQVYAGFSPEVDLPPSIDDCNPITVIRDLLTSQQTGKLGYSNARVDYTSFHAAELVVLNEGNGYSRVINQGQDAVSVINEILAQVDGIMYEDPSNNVIYIKLIRPDYIPSECKRITPDNAVSMANFDAGTWMDLPNQVRVLFTDRARNNATGSGVAFSQASQELQSNEIREVTLQFPGVCLQANADEIASRELQARNKPLMKCQMTVDRTFYDCRPGEVVMLTWPEANISDVPMRIINMTRGTLQNGRITMNLVQDYFYTWRRTFPVYDGGVITHEMHVSL